MTYKASDIVKKAEQLSDLTNTDFIDWNEKISLLNDAYTMLYQKLVDIGDGSFVKTFVAQSGENILPPDFWQLKSVNLVQNRVVTPVKRRASSENYTSLSYEIRYDRLYINGLYYSGDIVVDYWAKPVTLTYKPNPVILEPSLSNRSILGVHDEKYFSSVLNKLYWWDCRDNSESSAIINQTATRIIPGNEQAVVLTMEYKFIVTYSNKNVEPIPGVPVISESGAIGQIYNDKLYINGHVIIEDWDMGTDMEFIVCDENFTDFFYLQAGKIYHNGDLVLINGVPVQAANALFYVNGNCWYYTSNEVGYIDEGDNLHLVSMKPGCVGINKIDGNTGYGYSIYNGTAGVTVYPWVEDTVLDFPNSMYFTIMSYMLAVQFKIKQGADAQGLLTVLGTLENTFYDTLAQDANEPVRIRNVY